MGAWRIELFGKIRAVGGALSIERFPTKRTAELLVFLALHPDQQHSREFLADLIWPEADFASQLHSLRLALSRLRKLFGLNQPFLSTRSHIWVQSDQVQTDIRDFNDAVSAGNFRLAKSLYAKSIAPGIYADWLIGEQIRIDEMFDGISSKESGLQRSIPDGIRKLIGRQSELEQLDALFSKSSSVAITGIGGIGKTLLAANYAQKRDSALWVPLVDLGHPHQIAEAIRVALGSPIPSSSIELISYVCRELEELAPILVVLDNAEHVIGPELNHVVTRIVSLPNVQVLVTSRIPIALNRQLELPLGPVSDESAKTIFNDRVQAIRPGIQIEDAVLSQISSHFCGLPLAIELGAARVGIQSIAEIEKGIFPVIKHLGRSIGIEDRHQSLEHVVLTSLEYLSTEDRRAIGNLCVFRGGFQAEAAESVFGIDLGTLEHLRRCGFIVPYEVDNRQLRLRIPEPIRTLSLEQEPDCRRKHLFFMAEWVEQNRADQLPSPPFVFMSRLLLQNSELFNVEAALEFCAASEEMDVIEAGLRIVGAFWTHWYTANKAFEMERWANCLLERADSFVDPKIGATAQLSLGLAYRERGDYAAFADQVKVARQAFSEDELHRDAAFALHLSGLSSADLGRFTDADKAYSKAERLWKALGDDRNYSVTRHNRAMVVLELANYELAESFVWEALEFFNLHQSTYLGVGYSTLAQVFMAQDNLEGAGDAYRNAIIWNKKLGYIRGWAQNARDLSLVMQKKGESEQALELARSALDDFRRVGDFHGEATALCALFQISGLSHHLSEARHLVSRHGLVGSHELLKLLSTS